MTYKKKTTTETATVKASNTKKQTLGEFKAWLSGVEEMQPEGWSPDLGQWKKIRSKIDNIADSPKSFNSDGAGPSEENEQPARIIRPSGPSMLTPATLAIPQAPPPTFMNTSDTEGVRLKTPNVDTSSKAYTSSLE